MGIVRAQLEDTRAVVGVIIRAFEEAIKRDNEAPPLYASIPTIENKIERGEVYVAKHGELVVGGYIWSMKVPNILYLSRIFVDLEYQGEGLGKKLLKHFESMYRETVKYYTLHTVAIDEVNKKFYESNGYVKVHEEKPERVVLSFYVKKNEALK